MRVDGVEVEVSGDQEDDRFDRGNASEAASTTLGRRVPGGEQAGGSLYGARDRSASIAATDLPRIRDKTSAWKAGGKEWNVLNSLPGIEATGLGMTKLHAWHYPSV
jgi:hypothetical protein